MTVIRWILGRIILLLNAIFRPSQRKLSTEQKAAQQANASNLALYQFAACPFCVKVRRELHRLDLELPLRDAKNSELYRSELEHGGGRIKVPCLRIDEGDNSTWLYESNDIIDYLRGRFPAEAQIAQA
ncbi:glutathione S-transferase N-terminal domain-containing protein [Pseudoteredinibacter isoporae]|uniref:Glutaredoxin n=1 Tax=Pseudoteredinibacter isoporae TaxID=570281 RepID=A0A7X0MX74_9GAMM|nr:glutathione S-transferase N-terminal domain-containing protein [Pseudoteredinibacter isoporae]MBB6520592.1 glutaredoxin [Pseudoteredinibacter isoporae]NHO86159.1 glutaredoxin [Pseudoteredinibacter isoporae]NIB25390.1 glutaredoxin [Pseudoteredinibacter isoporae]